MSKDGKTVGELLRDAREAQGLSIESIAKDICVRSSYLIAIEADDFDELPETTFAVGFVRAYAMALKVDAKSIVAQFKEEFGDEEPAQISVPEAALVAPRRRLPAWLSPFAGVLGIAVCWAVFGTGMMPFAMTSDSQLVDRSTDVAQLQAVQATLPVSGQTDAVQAASDDGSADQANAEAVALSVEAPGAAAYVQASSLFSPAAIAEQDAATIAGRSDFTLQASEDAWVRLQNMDGTEIWSGVLREGQSYRPHFDGVALLSTSNAGGVSVIFGSEELAVLGTRGEVIENIRLDEKRLFSEAAASQNAAAGSR